MRKVDLVPRRVDVDDGVGRPEVLRTPAQLGVSDLEPARTGGTDEMWMESWASCRLAIGTAK